MSLDGKGILARLDATDREVSQAWSEAIAIALENHARAGVPVATWDDVHHRVLMIPPDKLPSRSAKKLKIHR